MPLPRLLHPVRTHIEPINKAQTTYDSDAREPIQNVTREARIVIPAQIEYRKNPNGTPGMEMPSMTPGGAFLMQVNYLLIRRKDADALGYSPAVSDRIAKIGHMDVDLYVKWMQPIAHYPDQNGWSLLRLYCQDREPGSLTRGEFD
jgi:hypothetical protein